MKIINKNKKPIPTKIKILKYLEIKIYEYSKEKNFLTDMTEIF